MPINKWKSKCKEEYFYDLPSNLVVLPHIDNSFVSVTIQDIDIWATALAVAFLRKNFLEQREEWEMVEEKALKWLSIKTNDDKDVLQEASKILSLPINDFCWLDIICKIFIMLLWLFWAETYANIAV